MRTPLLAALSLVSLGLLACGSENPLEDPPLQLGDPSCDPIMPVACGLPWPSNLYLRPDATRKTGYTLTFGATTLPADQKGVHINPAPYKRRDGYSIGTPLLLVFPGLDVSGMATEEHIERSLAADAQLLWFEVAGGVTRRVPYFVELDQFDVDSPEQTLFVRPAVILKEAARYVVALRGLRDRQGRSIEPSPAFARLRDNKSANTPALLERQPRFDEIFAILEAQGVPRTSLTLAWDFVTASSESMHGDLLAMRDDALRQVGAQGPVLKVETVTEYIKANDGSGKPVNEHIALELTGTFEVPSYLEPVELNGFTGSALRRDGTGRPLAQGTRKPRFWVRIPHNAVGGPPHGIVLYGHGLLGSGDQVRGSFNSKIAADHRLIYFAADLFGMSSEDATPVLAILQELSRFQSLTDRLHQGLVEWVLLTRAVRERLQSLPEVAQKNVTVNKGETYYSGISQGGIFGASFMALSPDVTYGHLGVPGNNYSTLLQRSVDFDRFIPLLNGSYGTALERNIGLCAIQLLWDSTDPVSHLRHITAEPYPGNQPHYVILAPAKGDYQVAVLTNEIAARSDIGIAVMQRYDRERSVALVTEKAYPNRGSGVVLYDFGNPWPPLGNQPPMRDTLGDPHGKPRREDSHNQQMVHFFRSGEIIDVCGGDGCHPTLR